MAIINVKNQTPFKKFLAAAAIKKDFLFRIFARKRTLKCLANFAPTQNAPNTKSRIGHA